MSARTKIFMELFFSGLCVSTLITPAFSDPDNTSPGLTTMIDHDGIYQVGKDILPGIYHTEGGKDNISCYWKRTSNNQIIDNGMSKKPQTILIEPTDTQFKTHHCQTWYLTECPPECPPNNNVDFLALLQGLVPQQNKVDSSIEESTSHHSD